jgi:hypothetical protein
VRGSGLLRARPAVLFEPAGENGFRKFAGGEAQEDTAGVFFAGLYLDTIQFEEDEGQDKARALVAIDKGATAIC